MTIFITGGCKNGKTTFALNQALRFGSTRYYVATMLPKDEEELRCVQRHRKARAGMDFTTIEQSFEIHRCFEGVGSSGVFLLDSVTALLANAMFPPGGGLQTNALRSTEASLGAFLDTAEHAVIVSDYIYSDGGDYSASSEAFRRGLAALDCMLARRCDTVVEICAGIPTVHKGELPWI